MPKGPNIHLRSFSNLCASARKKGSPSFVLLRRLRAYLSKKPHRFEVEDSGSVPNSDRPSSGYICTSRATAVNPSQVREFLRSMRVVRSQVSPQRLVSWLVGLLTESREILLWSWAIMNMVPGLQPCRFGSRRPMKLSESLRSVRPPFMFCTWWCK